MRVRDNTAGDEAGMRRQESQPHWLPLRLMRRLSFSCPGMRLARPVVHAERLRKNREFLRRCLASRLWKKPAAAGCGDWRPPKTAAFWGVAQVDSLSPAFAGWGHGWLFPRTASTGGDRFSLGYAWGSVVLAGVACFFRLSGGAVWAGEANRPPPSAPAEAGAREPAGQPLALKPEAGRDAADEQLSRLDQQWRETISPLVLRAEEAGAWQLADRMASSALQATEPADGRQTIYRIPPSIERSAEVVGMNDDHRKIWQDFVEAREQWADAVFAAAQAAAAEDRGCEAFRLLALAVVADPDHAEAREAGGWVKRAVEGDERWVSPEAARRLRLREVYRAETGWLPRTWLARYERGQRRQGERWVDQGAMSIPQSLADAAVWQSDHWQIRYLADEALAAQQAARLEEIHAVWWQAFGAFAMEPRELQRRFAGQHRIPPRGPMKAILFADKQQYVATLGKLEPQIARTLGIYWTPMQTAYFYDADDFAASTIFHEATHQLFSETRQTSRLAGEQNGFWALEAVACYMESLEQTATGWRLGGLQSGRAPMAVERLTLDNYYVPLEPLCQLGRVGFQSRQDLPPLYSQISGLADFFMNGQRARYREAFVTYLQQIYTGSSQPDSLALLCGVGFEELDSQYRRHVSR
jgi:hypothetical protein